MQRGEADESEARRHRQHLANMPEFEMAQFMGENRFDFLRRMLGEQRVEQHDALGLAEAGEIGVAARGSRRGVHHIEPARFEPAFLQQGLQPPPQIVLGERREFVEQWRDKGWIDRHHRDDKGHEADEGA